MSTKRKRTPTALIWDLLGSYGLAVVLLLCLFLLTLFGTLYQVDFGLLQAKKKFFDSFFLWKQVGDVSIPFFPGGLTCMSLLALNMLVGGLIRLRIGWRNAGVVVVHVGIAFLLISGLVKQLTADEGHLTLYEGKQSDEFRSYYLWEVAIWEPPAAGAAEVVERVIPHGEIADLTGDRARTFEHPDLPFELRLSGFVPNCSVMPKGPMWEATGPVVDGYGILAQPLDTTAERNVAGLHAEVRTGDGEVQQGILWGWENAPWTVQAGGRTWAITLRHTRYRMPFTIRLEDFVKEDHPGMTMAKAFRSDVTKIEKGREERIRIQMNEPLRHEGLVLFQSSWGPQDARPGEPLFSTFSVTRNVSDKWPEYSLYVITLGMLMAFGRKLFLYLRSQNRRRATASAAEPTETTRADALAAEI